MTRVVTDSTPADALWGPLAEPIHEKIPLVTGLNLPWRENAMFLFWDVDSEVYGVVHVSTSPNAEYGRRARCSVTVGNYSCEIVEHLPATGHSSESIKVDLARSISVDHQKLRLDITIQPLYGTIDLTKPRALGALEEHHPLHHYQRGFTARGTVSVDDAHRPVRAVGWRDRTWGFRDESAQWGEYFSLVTVMDDAAVMVLRMRGADGHVADFGWRVNDNGQQPVDHFELRRDASGLLADSRMVGDGFDISLMARRKPAGFWVPMGRDQNSGPTFSAYDEFVALESAGGAVCGGIAEHGILRRVV